MRTAPCHPKHWGTDWGVVGKQMQLLGERSRTPRAWKTLYHRHMGVEEREAQAMKYEKVKKAYNAAILRIRLESGSLVKVGVGPILHVCLMA